MSPETRATGPIISLHRTPEVVAKYSDDTFASLLAMLHQLRTVSVYELSADDDAIVNGDGSAPEPRGVIEANKR